MELSKEKVPFVELMTIWKTQPTEAGDTLSGGEDVHKLVRLGLVSKNGGDGLYRVTQKGTFVVQIVLEGIDKKGVHLSSVVEVEGLN